MMPRNDPSRTKVSRGNNELDRNAVSSGLITIAFAQRHGGGWQLGPGVLQQPGTGRGGREPGQRGADARHVRTMGSVLRIHPEVGEYNQKN